MLATTFFLVLSLFSTASGYHAALPLRQSSSVQSRRAAACDVQMINLFGNNEEAAKLKRQGKIKEGDEITMVSATFGDEMWSARKVGKYRLEKSIAVRQGMTISFVFESRTEA